MPRYRLITQETRYRTWEVRANSLPQALRLVRETPHAALGAQIVDEHCEQVCCCDPARLDDGPERP